MGSMFDEELFKSFTYQERIKYKQIQMSVTARNLSLFHITLTPKSKKQFPSMSLIKINMRDGWYIYITDNQVQSDQCIVTFHGAPGNHLDWSGLQFQLMKIRKCRWINFVWPGFDGEDERRGTLRGTSQDMNQIINHILNQRKINKIILCMHSFGNFFGMSYAMKNRQRIRGMIGCSGLLNHWQRGSMIFHQTIIVQSKISSIQVEKLYEVFNIDERRKYHAKEYEQNRKQYKMGTIDPPAQKQTQLISAAKIYQDVGGYQAVMKFQQSLNFLKLYILGQNDQFYDTVNYGYNFEKRTKDYCRQNRQLLENPSFVKEIKKVFLEKYKAQIDVQKLQEYFFFSFEDTGHNVHRRRAQETALVIDAYLTALLIIQSYSHLIQSKL